MRAMWNNTVLAESDDTVYYQGAFFFPMESVKKEYLRDNGNQVVSPWRGVSSYCDIVIGDSTNKDAAWYYKDPNIVTRKVKNHVAFDKDKGVIVIVE